MSTKNQRQDNQHVPTAGSRTATMEPRQEKAPDSSIPKPIEQAVDEIRAAEAALPRIEPGKLIEIEPGQSAVLAAGVHAFLGGQVRVMAPVKVTADESGLMFRALYGQAVNVRPVEVAAESSREVDRHIEHAILGMNQLPGEPEREMAGRMGDTLPERPTANIPKALHHLRRAANALHGDSFRPLLDQWIADVQLSQLQPETNTMLGNVAAALDLDHNAAGAAKDVRAAIEALS